MNKMNNREIIEKLRDDENYYGSYGKQWLSNSDIETLLNNPKQFQQDDDKVPTAFLIGGYFHTAILEPHKLEKFEVSEATSRNAKLYKDLGKQALLRHEVDNIDIMKATLEACNETRNMIYPLFDDGSIEYEVPSVAEIQGLGWKGKADIVNHEQKLIIDLKTTGDLLNFRRSASKYNYDSQAWIYKQLFGYDLVFVAVDKSTHRIGIFECDESFYNKGEAKVEAAVAVYKQWQADGFDPAQDFIYDKLN